MNNSAIYDRFIEMFLESSDDFEPYGAIGPDATTPLRVERSWGSDAAEDHLLSNDTILLNRR